VTANKKLRLLIVDDDEKIIFAFKQTFVQNVEVITAHDGESAFEQLRKRPDVAFLDITMPKKDGLTVLKELGDLVSEIPIIVITGYGTMQTAIEAMQLGAFDYITKPLNIQHLRLLVDRALEMRKSKNEVKHLITEKKRGSHVKGEIIGSHISMQSVFKKIGMVALTPNTTNVLITGESGTGKELVARAIHKSGMHNKDPFLGINCSALPEYLLESELFGHERGAFTGAVKQNVGKFSAAGNGTIFLDEIGDMPVGLQRKLLRVIEEREFTPVGSTNHISVNARFISATNKNLKKLVENTEFREDLYYRLHVFDIHIPALRERKDDIPALVDYFIESQNQLLNRSVKSIADYALGLLMEYDYPGNVRELQNIIISAMTQEKGDVLTLQNPPLDESGSKLTYVTPISSLNMREAKQAAIRRFEEQFVRHILSKTGGNITRAAKISGIERQSFQRIMRRSNLHSNDFKN